VWWGICHKFSTESNSDRILKIGQYLAKLWARVRCLVFLTHGVESHVVYVLGIEVVLLLYVPLSTAADVALPWVNELRYVGVLIIRSHQQGRRSYVFFWVRTNPL